jgi:hypothetical protein
MCILSRLIKISSKSQYFFKNSGQQPLPVSFKDRENDINCNLFGSIPQKFHTSGNFLQRKGYQRSKRKISFSELQSKFGHKKRTAH